MPNWGDNAAAIQEYTTAAMQFANERATLSKPLRSIKLLSDWIRPDKKPWTDCQISIFNAASLLIHW